MPISWHSWPHAASDPEYSSVPNDDAYSDEKTDRTSSPQPQETSRPRTRAGLTMALWGSILMNLLLVLLLARATVLSQRTIKYSFEKGYRTELAAAREWISVEEKRFDGSAQYNEQGKAELRDGGDLVYVGEPSEELDKAWFNLTDRRYFMVSEEEAHEAWPGEDISQFWDPIHGGYVAGLEVFHIVHCLGELRETLYPEWYGKKHAAHLSHCIEGIRQYIMCTADLTPIPTKFYSAANTTYIESDLVHTCRNYDRLQDFLHERREGPTAVVPLYRPYGYDETYIRKSGHT